VNSYSIHSERRVLGTYGTLRSRVLYYCNTTLELAIVQYRLFAITVTVLHRRQYYYFYSVRSSSSPPPLPNAKHEV